MILRDIFEGVTSSSEVALAAYIVTVAEAYAAAPVHDAAAERHWEALNRSTMDTLMKRLGGTGIRIEYSKHDPYASFTNDPSLMIRYMLYDMVVNKKLVIYTGDSQHPYFNEEQNVAFRTVHDFFAHGKIRTAFFKQLTDAAKDMGISKLPGVEKAGPLLARVDLSQYGNRGNLFNGRGELNAASTHIRLAPKEAAPALGLFECVIHNGLDEMASGEHVTRPLAIVAALVFFLHEEIFSQ